MQNYQDKTLVVGVERYIYLIEVAMDSLFYDVMVLIWAIVMTSYVFMK